MLPHQFRGMRAGLTRGSSSRPSPMLLLSTRATVDDKGPLNQGDDSLDVAVFRFTLGIPGFEDRMIPRVVAGLGASLMTLNHILTPPPYPDAQGRAEVLCALLAFVLAVAPEVEERLREARPGKGRQMVSLTKGATNVFALDPKLSEKGKQELAWSSFALLKNTNVCSIIVHSTSQNKVLMARGQFNTELTAGSASEETLSRLSEDISNLCSNSVAVSRIISGGAEEGVWLSDRTGMEKAGIYLSKSIPPGAESMLIQRIAGKGLLIVLSERSRALSSREQQWAEQMASKIAAFL